MGNVPSLQDVMNVVSRQLEAAPIVSAPVKALTEMEAFSSLDPLLSDLQKQYLDARAMRIKAARDFGSDDPMTDMAMLVEDSAWCAVQTRYMEVRDNRAMMAQAQAIMEETRIEEERVMKAKKSREADEQFKQIQFAAQMMERKKGYDGSAILLAIYVLLMMDAQGWQMMQATPQFNKLAA